MAGHWRLVGLLGLVGSPALGAAGATEPAALVEPNLDELVALEVMAPRVASPGGEVRAWVRASRPYANAPLVDTLVLGTLAIEGDDGDTEITAIATTNSTGRAELRFAVPDTATGSFELAAVVHQAGRSTTAQVDGWIADRSRVILSTDRRLYRPGETVHLRGLWLASDGRVRAGAPVAMGISGPRNRRVFRSESTTSRLGVAAADWPIPPSAPAGHYWIGAEVDGETAGGASIEVRPYELPRLRITLTPELGAYLPGDRGRLAVEVHRLDGEPVAGAAVVLRLVRDRWGLPVLPQQTATTNTRGGAAFDIELDEIHRWLEEGYRRTHLDMPVEAEVHDPSSGRVESVEATLRISREAVHLYLVGSIPAVAGAGGTWVSVSHADGRPAVDCRVRATVGGSAPILVTSDQYGLARLPIGEAQLAALADRPEDRRNDPAIELAGTCPGGERGHQQISWFDQAEPPAIAVVARRSLLRAGETLEVELVPSVAVANLRVEVWDRTRMLAARDIVRLDGRRDVAFAHQPAFRGVLRVRAFALVADGRDPYAEAPAGVTSVLYTGSEPLELSLAPQRSPIRPGESVAVDLDLGGSRGAESGVVAVAVLDDAVHQLERQEGLDPEPALLAGVRDEFELAGWTIDRLAREARPERFAEFDLAAEVLLNQEYAWADGVESNIASPVGRELEEHGTFFRDTLAPLLAAVRGAAIRGRFAWNRSDLETIAHPVDTTALRDPWGTSLGFDVSLDAGSTVLEVRSAGRDREWGSFDDFLVHRQAWSYLAPVGRALRLAISQRLRDGGVAALEVAGVVADARALGVDLATLVDPRGGGYRVEVECDRDGTVWLEVTTRARSAEEAAGAIGTGGMEKDEVESGDIVVWREYINWMAALDKLLRTSLDSPQSHLPTSPEAAIARLESLEWWGSGWRDPWGRSLRPRGEVAARFANRYVYRTPGSVPALEAVTEHFLEVSLHSDGPDGRPDTADDLVAARVSIALPSPEESVAARAVTGAAVGALVGRVFDEDSGTPLPGVTVTASSASLLGVRAVVTDSEGAFGLPPLAAGVYEVTFELDGYQTVSFVRVVVRAGETTRLEAGMPLGLIAEELVVTSEAVEKWAAARPPPRRPIATPRLRRNFPTTLLWLPALEVDGHARIELPGADTVTTWRLAALASTADGRIATARAEVVATLPFHVDVDVPTVATAGDQITVPVLVAEEGATAPDHANEPLFVTARLGGREQTAVVEDAPASARVDVTLGFASSGEAVVEVGAQRGEHADRLARTVSVRPHGRPRVVTVTRLLRPEAVDSSVANPEGGIEVAFEVPGDSLEGSARLEVVTTRGLSQHVRAAVAGLASMPRGCTEQVVSSASASLLLLELPGGAPDPARDRARVYLAEALEVVEVRVATDGGFTYWGGARASDLALTAHVVDFLVRAAPHLPRDPGDLLRLAVGALAQRQQADGGWTAPWSARDPIQELRTSTTVAMALARIVANDPSNELANEQARETGEQARASLDRAFVYLGRALVGSNDPHALAGATLAAVDAGEDELARVWAGQLRALAHHEEVGASWRLVSATPFYGWGVVGRLETTALAVRALAAVAARDARTDPVAEAGLLHLLVEKDALGMWWSTQSTLQALRALGALLPAATSQSGARADREPGVHFGDQHLALTSVVPGLPSTSGEIPVGAGRHAVVVRSPGETTLVQVIVRDAAPWQDSPPSPSVHFDVTCRAGDGASAPAPVTIGVGDPVTCRVEVDRRVGDGFGMLVAEVGLPPGAEVDETSVTGTRPDALEIWPDRVVTYVWPRAGGSSFSFTWRPRWPIRAHAAPSRLWDYYNPTAEAWVAPQFFTVE